MPEHETIERAREDAAEGKARSTYARSARTCAAKIAPFGFVGC